MKITLAQALASTTIEHLGSGADAYDLAAYREALTRAWHRTGIPMQPGGDPALSTEGAERLQRAVLEGRAGRDEEGRSWVQVADLARGREADLAARVDALYDLARGDAL